MVGRTCVVVAHRLSTIRNADTIAVLADGKIQEQARPTSPTSVVGPARFHPAVPHRSSTPLRGYTAAVKYCCCVPRAAFTAALNGTMLDTGGAAQGTHEELIKMNGLYATLGRRQFLLDQAQRNFGMEADQACRRCAPRRTIRSGNRSS